MKILAENNIAPIHLARGDWIAVTYTPRDPFKEKETLVHHCIENAEIINYIAIAELQLVDLKLLGLKSGYAAIVGNK